MGLLKLVRGLKRGYDWSQAVHFFQLQEYEKANFHFQRFAQQKKNISFFELAFEATIFIGLNRSKESNTKFKKIASELNGENHGSDSRYLYLYYYCKMYISLIEKDDQHLKHLSKLKSIPTSTEIGETLPLPDEKDLVFR